MTDSRQLVRDRGRIGRCVKQMIAFNVQHWFTPKSEIRKFNRFFFVVYRREQLINDVGHATVRRLECFVQLVLQFTLWIYGENTNDWNSNSTIGPNILGFEGEKNGIYSWVKSFDDIRIDLTYIDAIAVTGVEWIYWEKCLDITQAGNFELFWLAFDHLTMECRYQWCRIQKQRSIGKFHIALLNRSQIISCGLEWMDYWIPPKIDTRNDWAHPWLANGSCRQIQQFVSVLLDFRE